MPKFDFCGKELNESDVCTHEGNKENLEACGFNRKGDKENLKACVCGYENEGDCNFCISCGRALKNVCPICKGENEQNTSYCVFCGYRIGYETNVNGINESTVSASNGNVGNFVKENNLAFQNKSNQAYLTAEEKQALNAYYAKKYRTPKYVWAIVWTSFFACFSLLLLINLLI